MKVDFNNLRLQTAYALDNIIKCLNYGMMKTTHCIWDEPEYGNPEKRYTGDILIASDDIEDDIDDLRQLVFSLICCYEENNPEYISLCDELEKNGGLAVFKNANSRF